MQVLHVPFIPRMKREDRLLTDRTDRLVHRRRGVGAAARAESSEEGAGVRQRTLAATAEGAQDSSAIACAERVPAIHVQSLALGTTPAPLSLYRDMAAEAGRLTQLLQEWQAQVHPLLTHINVLRCSLVFIPCEDRLWTGTGLLHDSASWISSDKEESIGSRDEGIAMLVL